MAAGPELGAAGQKPELLFAFLLFGLLFAEPHVFEHHAERARQRVQQAAIVGHVRDAGGARFQNHLPQALDDRYQAFAAGLAARPPEPHLRDTPEDIREAAPGASAKVVFGHRHLQLAEDHAFRFGWRIAPPQEEPVHQARQNRIGPGSQQP
jgi:hypothetical protein